MMHRRGWIKPWLCPLIEQSGQEKQNQRHCDAGRGQQSIPQSPKSAAAPCPLHADRSQHPQPTAVQTHHGTHDSRLSQRGECRCRHGRDDQERGKLKPETPLFVGQFLRDSAPGENLRRQAPTAYENYPARQTTLAASATECINGEPTISAVLRIGRTVVPTFYR